MMTSTASKFSLMASSCQTRTPPDHGALTGPEHRLPRRRFVSDLPEINPTSGDWG
jgi:hypothetical protein